MYKYQHHNFAFSISTCCIKNQQLKSKIDLAIQDTFKGFLVCNTKKVIMEFIFTDDIVSFISDISFVRVNNIKVGNLQTHFKDDEIEFLVNNNNIFKIYLNVSLNHSLRSSLRFADKSYKNNVEKFTTIFYYRIFLLFSQLWNIKNNFSYLHSSAIEIFGKSIIFTADAGVGKSSLLYRLSKEKDYKFIADDLTIISSEAEVFFQGRRLSVKPYHLKYFSFLKKKLNTLMLYGQKIQWRLIKDNKLTFRIAPDQLFDKISKSSKLKRVIHLCNHSDEKFLISDISSKQLVKYTIPILINELFLANKKLNSVASLPNSPFINSSELFNSVSDIYLKAFKNVDTRLVLVPFMSDPNELYEFLKFEGCLD